jgi:acyl-CoA synthetase (AMP-forming)/AMP-acid ligase II
MEQWKTEPAVIWRDQLYRYQELLERCESWKGSIRSMGLSSGCIAALEGDFSLNACALLLALIDQKAIIVPLTKATGVHRNEFLEIAEVQKLLTFDEADNLNVENRNDLVKNEITKKFINEGNPGLVLFSSGSTGQSKAALQDFSRLLEKFKVPRHKMRALNFLLFDHIGGINTLFYTLSNGGVVVTTTARNPDRICHLIEKHRVELLPTTPTFLNLLVISEAHKNYDISSLKLITYGTEVMPESVLKRVNQAFPKVRLLQTYGLSELGILRSQSKASDSLWMKVGGEGFETKVVDGVLWIKAPSAMVGYLNAASPYTEDGWFITGDAVEVDGEYIRVMGRKSEIINVGGEKVYPVEVESVIQSMPGVEDVAVSGEANPITGQIVKARVKINSGEPAGEFRKRIRDHCRARLASYKIPQRIEIVHNTMYSDRFKKMRREDPR